MVTKIPQARSVFVASSFQIVQLPGRIFYIYLFQLLNSFT
jgi:hypothetical protein